MLSSTCWRLLVLILVALPSPCLSDWLLTADGEIIETKGAWEVRGSSVVFTAKSGILTSLRRSSVDLDASQLLTSHGGPDVSGTEPRRTAAEEVREPVLVLTDGDVRRDRRSRRAGPPLIVMYTTDWCGYCKKAKRLLVELGADFVEHDVEKDSAAAQQHRMKSGGRGGVPFFDFNGQVLRGYSESMVRQMVVKQRDWSASRQSP